MPAATARFEVVLASGRSVRVDEGFDGAGPALRLQSRIQFSTVTPGMRS